MATYQPRKTRPAAANSDESPSAIDAILNATGEMQAIRVDPADIYVDDVEPLPIVVQEDTVEPEPVVSDMEPSAAGTGSDDDLAPLDEQQAADLAAQLNRPVTVPVLDPPSTKDQKALILAIAGGILVAGGVAAVLLTRRG